MSFLLSISLKNKYMTSLLSSTLHNGAPRSIDFSFSEVEAIMEIVVGNDFRHKRARFFFFFDFFGLDTFASRDSSIYGRNDIGWAVIHLINEIIKTILLLTERN